MTKEPGPDKKSDRREFLKYGGLGLLGLSMGPLLSTIFKKENDVSEIIRNPSAPNGKTQRISLLHTAELAGQLEIHDEILSMGRIPVVKKLGGLATIYSALIELRKDNPLNSLLLYSGNLLYGNAITELMSEESLSSLLSRLPYDVILPGNGEPAGSRINTCLRKLNKPIISGNYIDSQEPLMAFPPYQLFYFSGIRIGVIGYQLQEGNYPEQGHHFVSPEKNLQVQVRHLRNEKKCDIVLMLSGLGHEHDCAISEDSISEGVDYVLGLNKNKVFSGLRRGKYSVVAACGPFGANIGKLDIVLEDGKIKGEVYQLYETDPEKFKSNQLTAEIVEKIKEPRRAYLSEITGTTNSFLHSESEFDSPCDQLIAASIAWKFGSEIVVLDRASHCTPLVPDPASGKADISREYLMSLIPDDMPLRCAEVKGKSIMNWIEKHVDTLIMRQGSSAYAFPRFKGLQVIFKKDKDRSKRMLKVMVRNEKLDPERTYSIVGPARKDSAAGMLCGIFFIQQANDSGLTIREVAEEFLAERSPVTLSGEAHVIMT